MSRVLVCGGREFGVRERKEKQFLYDVLDAYHARQSFELVIHGGQTGADTLAGKWAQERYIEVKVYEAKWRLFGKAAGPLRNLRMLTHGKPDYVVAFKGGVGTLNMIGQAYANGAPVRDHRKGEKEDV